MILKKRVIDVVFIESTWCLFLSLADKEGLFFLINAMSRAFSVLFATKSTCFLVTKCSFHRATVKGRPSRDFTMSLQTHFAQSPLTVSTLMQHLSLMGNAKKSPLLLVFLLSDTVLAHLVYNTGIVKTHAISYT